ncbi:hypothetical protein F4778DRAFT_786722 [Xylariomycetidae sp. FL2044]|nr:hypothetical protein F4778DRAFT_786722 [Xylariomycetidae sp. FL2044]
MKCATSLVSVGLLALSTSAAPVEARQEGIALYTLQISSPQYEDLDGSYLSITNSTLGIFAGSDISPVRVYETASAKEGCKELHTYPVGFVDHSLALIGSPGLLTLEELTNPGRDEPDDGKVMLWDTFIFEDAKVKNDASGQWLAFPSADNGWQVKWADGSAATTTDYMPVEVLLKSDGEGRYNDV